MRKNGILAAGGGALLLALMTLWGSFYTVGTGYRGVLTEFGKIIPGVVDPGIHLKLPFIIFRKKTPTNPQDGLGDELRQ